MTCTMFLNTYINNETVLAFEYPHYRNQLIRRARFIRLDLKIHNQLLYNCDHQ